MSGCENMESVGSSIYLACAVDLNNRFAWFPAIGHRDASVTPNGGITLLDAKKETSHLLKMTGFDSEFAPHGISVLEDPNDSNTVWVAAVNHKRDGSVIELFTHVKGTDELLHRKTVKDPLIVHPNGINPFDLS